MPIKARTKTREAREMKPKVKEFTKKSPLSTPKKQKQMKIDKFVRNSPLKTESLEIKSEKNADDNWNAFTSGLGSNTEFKEQKSPPKSPRSHGAEILLFRTNQNQNLSINSRDSNFSENSDIIILEANSIKDNPTRPSSFPEDDDNLISLIDGSKNDDFENELLESSSCESLESDTMDHEKFFTRYD